MGDAITDAVRQNCSGRQTASQRTSLRAIPSLRVSGDLDLRECTELEELPDGLEVEGDVLLTSCIKLRRVGAVRVKGTLVCKDCMALTSISPEAQLGGIFLQCTGVATASIKTLPSHIFGDVTIQDNINIDALPDGLRVDGNLRFENCPELTALPANLHVGGSLVLDNVAFDKVPHGLSVNKRLAVTNCARIVSLSGASAHQIEVASCCRLERLGPLLSDSPVTVSLSDCPRLRFLPDHVPGSLRLLLCPALQMLPKALRVEGDLEISFCSGLQGIPPSANVFGAISLHECSALTELPCSARMDSLIVDGCEALESLQSLPQGLYDLKVRACALLRHLPETLHLGGSLEVFDCPRLAKLPSFLTVGRNLALLGGCPRVRSLPSRLAVGGDLRLTGACDLTSLPHELVVGEDLYLDGCTWLTSLPAEVLAWPPRNDGTPHQVYICGTGIGEQAAEWLRSASAGAAIRFHTSRARQGNAADEQIFSSLEEALHYWGITISQEELALPRSSERSVLLFLGKLRYAKEMVLDTSRDLLRFRLQSAFASLVGADTSSRAEVIQRIEDSVDACHDKPIWALNQLELVARVAAARDDAVALRDLGGAVMRLMIVHEHARRKVQAMEWTDDVCVYLIFEIELREALDLPVSARAMHFPSYVTVSAEELDAAKNEALNVDEAAFELWLANWSPWQRLERVQAADQMVWSNLPKTQVPASLLCKQNLSGEPIHDPVCINHDVWSLADALRHWVDTGLCVSSNLRINAIDIQRLKRAVPKSRRSRTRG